MQITNCFYHTLRFTDDACDSTNDSNYNTKFNYVGIHVLIEFPISHIGFNDFPTTRHFQITSSIILVPIQWGYRIFWDLPFSVQDQTKIICSVGFLHLLSTRKLILRTCSETEKLFRLIQPRSANIKTINVCIKQRDAHILVNNLYFFVKCLYIFRIIFSPSSGATFNKL